MKIDIRKKYAKANRIDVLGRAIQVLENRLGRSFTKDEYDDLAKRLQELGCTIILNDLKHPKINLNVDGDLRIFFNENSGFRLTVSKYLGHHASGLPKKLLDIQPKMFPYECSLYIAYDNIYEYYTSYDCVMEEFIDINKMSEGELFRDVWYEDDVKCLKLCGRVFKMVSEVFI